MLHTLYVIVFIGHGRRRIMHLNVTRHPTASWVWRQLLEATPWGEQPRHLIRDRDRCYGTDFIARASRIGIHTPVHAPNANAVAERVIGTLRRECLDHLIVLNERHLLHVLHEYTVHYNAKRPHRTLVLDSPEGREPQPKPGATATSSAARCSAASITSTSGRPHDVLHPHGSPDSPLRLRVSLPIAMQRLKSS